MRSGIAIVVVNVINSARFSMPSGVKSYSLETSHPETSSLKWRILFIYICYLHAKHFISKVNVFLPVFC